MKKETAIQNKILLALSEAGCTVWRNATSYCWVGKVVYKDSDTVTLSAARPMQAGLCVGSSDIIGIHPSGRFLAIEVKRFAKGSNASAEQNQFIDAVRNAGGIAGIARSPQEALELIGG